MAQLRSWANPNPVLETPADRSIDQTPVRADSNSRLRVVYEAKQRLAVSVYPIPSDVDEELIAIFFGGETLALHLTSTTICSFFSRKSIRALPPA